MPNDDLVIVESIVELNRPRYTRNDLSAMNSPAVGLWLSCSVFMVGLYISHPLILGVGISGIVVFAWVLAGQYSLIAGMVSTQTTTNYYESLDNPTDDNLSFHDESETGTKKAYGYFGEWGTDVDKFGIILSHHVKSDSQITRKILNTANSEYKARNKKSAIPSLNDKFTDPPYEIAPAKTALMQAGFVDSIVEGEARYMLPTQKLLDYRMKA